MRKFLTFLEALWLMCFYYNLNNFNWWLTTGLILTFPRWGAFFDAVKVQQAKKNEEDKKLIKDLEDENRNDADRQN